jgi:hypothetical protein
MPEFDACRVVRIIRAQKTYQVYLAPLKEGSHNGYGAAQPQFGSLLEFNTCCQGSGDVRLRKKLFSGKHTAIKIKLHCPVRSG